MNKRVRNKGIRKFLTLFLVLSLVFGALPSVLAEDTTASQTAAVQTADTTSQTAADDAAKKAAEEAASKAAAEEAAKKIQNTSVVNGSFNSGFSDSRILTWYQDITGKQDDQTFGWKTTEQTQDGTTTRRLMEVRTFKTDQEMAKSADASKKQDSYGLGDGLIKDGNNAVIDGYSLTNGMAEINSNHTSSIYQDLKTTPGTVLNYSFWHGARASGGQDQTCAVLIGPSPATDNHYNSAASYTEGLTASGTQLNNNENDLFHKVYEYAVGTLKITDDQLAQGYTIPSDDSAYPGWYIKTSTASAGFWSKAEGSYAVPEGQDYSVIGFISAGAGKTDTTGNLITGVNTSCTAEITYQDSINDQYAIDTQTTTVSAGDATPAYGDGSTPLHPGYYFTGWNTAADGNGSGWSDKAQTGTTYYAIWKPAAQLTVTEKVNGYPRTDTPSFDYTASFTAADGSALNATYYYRIDKGGLEAFALTPGNNSFSFSLRSDQSITFYLDDNVGYSVTQTENDSFAQTINDAYTGSGTVTGSLSENMTEAYTNTWKTGSFIVRQTADGDQADAYTDFTVGMKGAEEAYPVRYYENGEEVQPDAASGQKSTIKSGEKTTLKSGQSLEVENLPIGAGFSVTEKLKDGYTQTVNDNPGNTASGTIVYDEPAVCSFVSTQNQTDTVSATADNSSSDETIVSPTADETAGGTTAVDVSTTDNFAAFVNDVTNAATGIVRNPWTWVILVVLIAAVVVLVAMKKKNSGSDNDEADRKDQNDGK